ncbi:MAG: hypothetical protein WEE89_15920 [Gemmatimonadota bacterium]
MAFGTNLKRFGSELRRRHVGRVAIGYAVSAWLLVEIADTIFPRLLLPDWSVSFLIGLAIVGFPVAVMLAWWFDVVPDPAGHSPARWLGRAVVSVAILSAAGFASVQYLPKLVDPTGDIESVVVLPFENTSGKSEEEYFALGIGDEVIAALSQVSSVRVISRRSALRYRASVLSVPEIAKQLGVRAVVEGQVTRSPDGVQVRIALIRPFPKERQLWTRTFTRQERDVLALQSDIARGIAENIQVELSDDESARLNNSRSVDSRVYELYLRGNYLINNRSGGRAAVFEGLQYFHQAIDLDPANAKSYAAMANAYATLGHAWIHLPGALDKASAAAERAINLDPTLADGYHALAKVKMYRDWDWPGAEAAFRKALALNPSLAAAQYEFAFHRLLFGDLDDAIRRIEAAARLNPFAAPFVGWAGTIYMLAGRIDDAELTARNAIEIAPNAPVGHVVLGDVYSEKKMFAEAIETHQQLVKLNPRGKWMLAVTLVRAGRINEARAIATELESDLSPFNAYGLGAIYAALNDHDRAFKWLNHGEPHAWLPWVRVLPEFKNLRDDPRFAALLERMHLPPR